MKGHMIELNIDCMMQWFFSTKHMDWKFWRSTPGKSCRQPMFASLGTLHVKVCFAHVAATVEALGTALCLSGTDTIVYQSLLISFSGD